VLQSPRVRTFIASITQRCNLRCNFCLEDRLSRDRYVEPSTQQVAQTLKTAWDDGARRVTFMGAETLLRPDVIAILDESRRLGFADITVATNGVSLARPGYLRTLMAHGLEAIELSIHGHTETLANTIAGTPFAFRRQAAALAEINATAGLKLFVNVVVCQENREHLIDIARYLAAACPRTPLELKLKFVGLQGRALQRARTEHRFLRYSDVDAVALGRALTDHAVAFLFYNFPLCRLGSYAQLSLEHGTLATDARYTDPNADLTRYIDSGHQLAGRVWPSPPCADCTLQPVCGGIEESYRLLAGARELSPCTSDPAALLTASLARAGLDPLTADARLRTLASLPRPRTLRAARGSPTAVRFNHPAEAEPLELQLAARQPGVPAYVLSERFALSYRSWTSGDAGRSPHARRLLVAAAAAVRKADHEGLSLEAACKALATASCAGWIVQLEDLGP
jgi:MoaA/NifB/PqqE/SkfB family radical SAM enzyme